MLLKLPHLFVSAMGSLRFGSNLLLEEVPCSIHKNASVIPSVAQLGSSQGRFTVRLIFSQAAGSHFSLYLLPTAVLFVSTWNSHSYFCVGTSVFLFFPVAVIAQSVRSICGQDGIENRWKNDPIPLGSPYRAMKLSWWKTDGGKGREMWKQKREWELSCWWLRFYLQDRQLILLWGAWHLSEACNWASQVNCCLLGWEHLSTSLCILPTLHFPISVSAESFQYSSLPVLCYSCGSMVS